MLKIFERDEINAFLELSLLVFVIFLTILVLHGFKDILTLVVYLFMISIIFCIPVFYILYNSDIIVQNSTSDKL